MNNNIARHLARAYWDKHGAQITRGGMVIIMSDETVVGWSKHPAASKYEPDTVGVNFVGDVYRAVGGNKLEGASSWERA